MDHPGTAQVVEAWMRIADEIQRAIEGLSDAALDLRGGQEGWSIRENVHHLVEANLVASNIVLAALATNGGVFDWSWVNPDVAWMRRVGYDKAPIGPALETLRALGRHIAGLVAAAPDGLQRQVRLLDAPGAALYSKTVEGVLHQEVEHIGGHLADVARTRAAHGI